MLLFKRHHAPLILDGSKTQTRRLWPHGCRVKAGSLQWAQLSYRPATRFARLEILAVRQERLGSISVADALAEGGYTPETYLTAFFEINRKDDAMPRRFISVDTVVYVVSFKLVREP